jgi:hypothetical protein
MASTVLVLSRKDCLTASAVLNESPVCLDKDAGDFLAFWDMSQYEYENLLSELYYCNTFGIVSDFIPCELYGCNLKRSFLCS